MPKAPCSSGPLKGQLFFRPESIKKVRAMDWREQLRNQATNVPRRLPLCSGPSSGTIDVMAVQGWASSLWATLMDSSDQVRPIQRRAILPPITAENPYGRGQCSVRQENRNSGGHRPGSIVRPYHDENPFAVTDVGVGHCRRCFHKEYGGGTAHPCICRLPELHPSPVRKSENRP